jgi:hypothetical protein
MLLRRTFFFEEISLAGGGNLIGLLGETVQLQLSAAT